jgi:hypothetical protein
MMQDGKKAKDVILGSLTELAVIPDTESPGIPPSQPCAGETPVDMAILRRAKEQPLASQVTVWSPELGLILEYLASTTPKFSKSAFSCKVLEAYFQREYPALWAAACTELANQSHGPRQRRSRRL